MKILHPNQFKNYLHDLPSSLAVFFVAVPLCLGIALASGAPLFAGLVAGILGGIVAGSLSGSPLAVTGPAAGLTSIVLLSIQEVGSYQAFLTAVVLAGGLQIALGFARAGVVGHFVPSTVVKGMLAGIGIILILKQIPHAFGDDADYEGDESFFQPDDQNTITEIIQSALNFSSGAIIIALSSLVLLLLWGSARIRNHSWLHKIPGPLVAVMLGVFMNSLFKEFMPALALPSSHLVDLPDFTSMSGVFSFPDWSVLTSKNVYVVALTVAVVASLETLLSIDAADKMDPYKRITPVNRELKAQGATNLLSGLLGGLPVTAVIVRTSANVDAGARTKASTILHGIILLLAILIFPNALEMIPLASLAAILILIGYKLAAPALWKEMFRKGRDQFLPFAVTVVGIVFSNLLWGVFIGILVSVFFVLKSNFQSAMLRVNNGESYLIKFTKDVSFFNRSTLVKNLEAIPNNATLLLEGSQVRFFDHDIIELITDFQKSAVVKNINVEIKKTRHALHPFFKSEA